jgi:hypothetical protein
MRNLIDCIGILKIILLENISKSPPFTKGDLGGFRKLSLQSEMRIPHNPSLKKRGNKKQVRHLLWIFIIMIFILVGTPMKGIAFEDAIIAVVNDELITLKDLRDYVHSTYVSLLTQGMNDAQLNEIMKDLKENGINKLIEDRLIMSRANEIGILVRDKLVDDKVEQIKGKYKSEQVF